MLIGRFDGADGMKTGFICAAGFNQVSSATRNGRTIISIVLGSDSLAGRADDSANLLQKGLTARSEEHTSELQSLMRISYAVFCLKKKNEENTLQTATTI